jgi:hypothetical protein
MAASRDGIQRPPGRDLARSDAKHREQSSDPATVRTPVRGRRREAAIAACEPNVPFSFHTVDPDHPENAERMQRLRITA